MSYQKGLNVLASVIALSLAACTSKVSYNAPEITHEQASDMAELLGIDPDSFANALDDLITENGSLKVDGKILSPEELQVIACVADGYQDGMLNTGDISYLARQYGRTCPEIAAEGAGDSDLGPDWACMNVDRSTEGVTIQDAVLVVTLFYNPPSGFNQASCEEEKNDYDGDHVAAYTEAFARIDTDPLVNNNDHG